MKKLWILTIIMLLAVSGAWADTKTLTISSDPGVDSFTATGYFSGGFNISISGTYVGTVHLQRSHDSGATWKDVTYWTSEEIEAKAGDPANLPYRIGIKNGNYTSGTVNLRLSD